MQEKKGISLIVLVITIIVMVILAAAIVITISNTGIIDRAQEAKDVTEKKALEELANVAWAEAAAKQTTEEKDDAYYQTEVMKYLKASGYTEAILEKYAITATAEKVGVEPVPEILYFGELYKDKWGSYIDIFYEDGSAIIGGRLRDSNVNTVPFFSDYIPAGTIRYVEDKIYDDSYTLGVGMGTISKDKLTVYMGTGTCHKTEFSPIAVGVAYTYTSDDGQTNVSFTLNADNTATLVNNGNTQTAAAIIRGNNVMVEAFDYTFSASYDGQQQIAMFHTTQIGNSVPTKNLDYILTKSAN